MKSELIKKYPFLGKKLPNYIPKSITFEQYAGAGMLLGLLVSAFLSIVMPDYFISLFGDSLICNISVLRDNSCQATYQGALLLIGMIAGTIGGALIWLLKKALEVINTKSHT